MPDTPTNPNGSGPGSQPSLTVDQGAARLGSFGTPSTPRGERVAPGVVTARQQPPAYEPEQQTPSYEQQLEPEPEAPDSETSEPDAPLSLKPDTVLWADPDGTPVTLEEARQSRLRTEDYHRKVGLVAETRRQLEGGYHELNADREAVAQFILRSLPDLSPERIAREQMSGEQVYRLQQESQQLLGFVQSLRGRMTEDQRRLEAHEVETARAMAPEIIGGWSDPKVMEREIQQTREWLDRRGVPAATQAKLARDPWLASLAVDAAKFAQVRVGGQRGRESQQRAVQPSLPAQDQAPALVGGQRDKLRQVARGAGTMRQRHDAAAALLRGVPIRR